MALKHRARSIKGLRARMVTSEAAYLNLEEMIDSYEVPRCGECEYFTIDSDSSYTYVCTNESCDNYNMYIDSPDGPMFNYYYPLFSVDDAPDDFDPIEAAIKIKNLPLCVVHTGDHMYGLALTGGGQDMTWEIIEAFISLGYLPPAFLEPKAHAGTEASTRNLTLLKAAEASQKFIIKSTKYRLEGLKSTRKKLI